MDGGFAVPAGYTGIPMPTDDDLILARGLADTADRISLAHFSPHAPDHRRATAAHPDPQHLLTQLREQGLPLSVVAERVLRFTPPLNLTEEELAWGLDTLDAVLRRYR